MASPKIKICGVRSEEQAVEIAKLGVDYIGMIFYEKSPRHVSDGEARRIVQRVRELDGFSDRQVFVVGVFVNPSPVDLQRKIDEIGFDMVQLAGDESPALASVLKLPVIKTIRVRKESDLDTIPYYQSARKDITFLFDTYSEKAFGGTGKSFDYSILESRALFFKEHDIRYFIAGGLNPDNIFNVLKYGPFGVDVNSGVEVSPGVKDLEKISKVLSALGRSKK